MQPSIKLFRYTNGCNYYNELVLLSADIHFSTLTINLYGTTNTSL